MSTAVQDILEQSYRSILLPEPAIHFQNFPRFDECIKGLRPREYSIFCGATGSGKTQILSQFAVDLLKQDIGVYVASVETGPYDFVRRMVSGVAKKNWNLGEPVGVDQFDRFRRGNAWFEKMPMRIALYENRIANDELLADIRESVEVHGSKVAILDNLNFFMEVTRSADTILEMDKVVHDAIIFCKEVDVHLIMVMHPKKTDHGRVEDEFDIKGSSTAVQEAHNVFLWNRPGKKKLEEDYERFKNFRELKIAKCRRYGAHVGNYITFNSPEGVSYEERRYDEIKRNY